MRVLFVSELLPHLPCHDGVRADAAHLLQHLSERHAVALVAMAGRGDGEGARRWAAAHAQPCVVLPASGPPSRLTVGPGNALNAVTPAVDAVVESFRPDVLHLDGALLAPLARCRDVPTVLATRGSRTLQARDLRRIAGAPIAWVVASLAERAAGLWERRWFARADACVVPSQEDRLALAAVVPSDRVDVIPSGLDLRRYPFRALPRPDRIVFTGELASPSDVDAARRLATAVLPRVRRRRPAAELVLAGMAPARELRTLGRLAGVRIVGPVSDVRLMVATAAVFASARRAGLGPTLPVLEAMALGAPVVGTPRSFAGLDVAHGNHALVAEDDEALADAIAAVLEQPVLGTILARNARMLVERDHSWPRLVRAWEAVLARPLARQPASPERVAA